MMSLAKPGRMLQNGLAALLVLGAGAIFSPRMVDAQSMTMDFTINSDINSPTTSATIAPNSTYTIDVWVVALPGANSPPSAPLADLGFTSTYFGARSSGTGAIVGGTASATGVSSGVGLTAYTAATGFKSNNILPGDWNSDGINDVSSLNPKTTTENAITSSASNVFANTSGNGGEADGAGWAWEVGTFTVTTGATIGGNGTSTIFSPVAAAFTGARDDWTFNGGSTQVSNSTTPTAYPLVVGSAVTFAAPAGVATQTIDDSGNGTFGGTAFSGAVASSGTYAGLTSTVGAGTGALGPNSGGIEHSVATILMGTNSGNFTGGAANVGILWRTRLLDETPANDSVNGSGFPNGTPTSPPLRSLPLISDVARLYGMNSSATSSSTTPVQTDPFVLQMSFNPATLLAEGATNADMATRGNLYLATLIGGTWQNAITDDFAINGTTSVVNVNGTPINVGDSVEGNNFLKPVTTTQTFAQWAAANGVTPANIGSYLGAWGVDPDLDGSYSAWAIVNHNSDFAVVPEPSTILLAAFGLLGGICVLRCRKSLAVA